MDELALTVLKAEVAEDCRVLAQTSVLARQRFGKGADQLALRIAKAFENNIDDEQGPAYGAAASTEYRHSWRAPTPLSRIETEK